LEGENERCERYNKNGRDLITNWLLVISYWLFAKRSEKAKMNAVRDTMRTAVTLSPIGYWLSVIGYSRSALTIVAIGYWLLAIGYSQSAAESIDQRDFSIDTFRPRPNEMSLAEKRAQRYWAKHRTEYESNTRYLAVEAATILAASLVYNTWSKLINSETTTSFFAHGDHFSYSNLDLKGILIYDVRNNQFAERNGYVSVDLPRRNHLARWDKYIARFIGTGRFANSQ
jgi:hypothetical protein